MQRAGSDAVEVWNVSADDGAELRDVEVCVAERERVEGPLDDRNILLECIFPLPEFDREADSAILVLREYADDMGVEKGHIAAAARECESEADDVATGKCAEDVATGLVGNGEQGGGDDVFIRVIPHGTLDRLALAEVFDRSAGADGDVGRLGGIAR